MFKNSVGVNTGIFDFLKSLMFRVIIYITPACRAASCRTESSKSVNLDSKEFPTLDNFKYKDKRYVIDIGGNNLRIMAMVLFKNQKF